MPPWHVGVIRAGVVVIRRQRQMMAFLLLDRSSGEITFEAGDSANYGHDHGFLATPAVVDGDACVMFLRNDDRVATAQPFVL
jgi:hypothetical protein